MDLLDFDSKPMQTSITMGNSSQINTSGGMPNLLDDIFGGGTQSQA